MRIRYTQNEYQKMNGVDVIFDRISMLYLLCVFLGEGLGEEPTGLTFDKQQAVPPC